MGRGLGCVAHACPSCMLRSGSVDHSCGVCPFWVRCRPGFGLCDFAAVVTRPSCTAVPVYIPSSLCHGCSRLVGHCDRWRVCFGSIFFHRPRRPEPVHTSEQAVLFVLIIKDYLVLMGKPPEGWWWPKDLQRRGPLRCRAPKRSTKHGYSEGLSSICQ